MPSRSLIIFVPDICIVYSTTPQRFRAGAAIPQQVQNTPQAPIGAPPTYRGVPHQHYQGSRTSSWGQPYHPYQHAPVEARGWGYGQCGRGPDSYQMHEPPLPPHVAAPQCPVSSPPNDLHFADDRTRC